MASGFGPTLRLMPRRRGGLRSASRPAGSTCWAENGLFASDDGGQSYDRVTSALPQSAEITALAVASQPAELLLAVIDGQIMASEDGGGQWQRRAQGLGDTPIDTVALDPASPQRVWAAGADPFMSATISAPPGARSGSLARAGTRVRGVAADAAAMTLVVTSHRGMYRSEDGGQSWTFKEGNLPVHLESGPLVRDPNDQRTLYAVYSLMPYAEVWRTALEGGNLLARVDPVSLAGGLAFLLLMIGGGLLARRLAGARSQIDAGHLRAMIALRRRGWLAAAVVTIAALAAAAVYFAFGLGSRPQFVEYPMQEPQDMPIGIAAAGDGTVWFSIGGADAIGRVRDGQLERLPKPGKSVEPIGIAVAPDGSAWYTDIAAQVVAHDVFGRGVELSAEHADGAARTAGRGAGRRGLVRRVEQPEHHQAEGGRAHPSRVPDPQGGPYGVAVAADGTVWATLQAGNQLLRIPPDGAIEALNLPRPAAVPTDIAIAPDGAVWFIEFRGNSIGRLKDGEFAEFPVTTENAGLTGLAVADDGAVWFGMLRAGSLGRLRDGEVKTFKLPRDDAALQRGRRSRRQRLVRRHPWLRRHATRPQRLAVGRAASGWQGRQLVGGLDGEHHAHAEDQQRGRDLHRTTQMLLSHSRIFSPTLAAIRPTATRVAAKPRLNTTTVASPSITLPLERGQQDGQRRGSGRMPPAMPSASSMASFGRRSSVTRSRRWEW